jgi:DNA-binding PadR family transcriptional regulator
MAAPPPSTVDRRARMALPLTPVALHILLALVDRDRHGLGIARHVEDFSSGRVALGPGTLYGAMKRLLDLGLVADTATAPADDAPDPRRRYYRLTDVGRRALEIETHELAGVLDVARLKGLIR